MGKMDNYEDYLKTLGMFKSLHLKHGGDMRVINNFIKKLNL